MLKIAFLFSFFLMSTSFSLRPSISSSIPYHQNPNGSESIPELNNNFEAQLIDLVNKKRVDRGLNALRLNKDLMRASRYHAADMANENYHDHATHNRTSSGLSVGMTTFKRIAQFYKGAANTENIAAGYNSPDAVLLAWLNSSGHRKNLFNKSATHLGVGYYVNANSKFKHYWVFESAVE